jgi:aminotransferase in exopolysaccharide biosynthesis
MKETFIRGLKQICMSPLEAGSVGLHEPDFKGTNAWKYVNDCLDTAWVSSGGIWVENFERELSKITGARYVVAMNNGTAALRMALYVVGVRHGDEVLIPPMTFVASGNAAAHLGANLHFIDIDDRSLGICPVALQQRLEAIAEIRDGVAFNKETGKRLSAIITVHIFGNPALIDKVLEVANHWHIPVIEDAAEALGSWYKGRHCGLYGEVGCISFNGNKIVTTGGGGAIVTNNRDLYERVRHLSTTAKRPHKWEFFHDQVGWNDRLPSINAAIGVAQLEIFEDILSRKRLLLKKYQSMIEGISGVSLVEPLEESVSNNWLISILVKDSSLEIARSEVLQILDLAHKEGIFLRPIWNLLHTLPMYAECPHGNLEKAEAIAPRLISLPSSPSLVVTVPRDGK